MPSAASRRRRFAQFALGGKIERVGWLIEQKLTRPVHQRPRNQDAALFSRGHFPHKLLGKMQCFHAFQRLHRALAHFLGHVQIGPECGRREESRDHGVEAGSDRGPLARQLGSGEPRRDDTEVLA